MKLIFFFLFLFISNNCSLNKDSKYWTQDILKKTENQKKLEDRYGEQFTINQSEVRAKGDL